MYILQTNVVRRGAVTIPEFVTLRKMNPYAAEIWIKANKPELEPEEVIDLLAAVGDAYIPIQAQTVTRFPERPRFVAAAWLAGASWGQLASMFGVTRPTLIRSTDRYIPSGRQAYRLAIQATHHKISLMREAFLRWYTENPNNVVNVSVVTLAAKFHSLESIEDTNGDPYLNGDEGIQSSIPSQDPLGNH